MNPLEAERMLKKEGFKYLGSANILDCSTQFWAKKVGKNSYLVAEIDGWWGDYTPRIYKVDRKGLERVCTTIVFYNYSGLSKEAIEKRVEELIKVVE